MTNLVNEERLRKKLQEANFFLQRYPEDSRKLESVARALYWIGDDSARACLVMVAQAAETEPNYDPMRAGNYYRLAGEIEKPTNTSNRLTGDLRFSEDNRTP